MRAWPVNGDSTVREAERTAETLCAEIATLNHDFWSGRSRSGDASGALARARRLHGRRAIEDLRRRLECAEPGSDRERRVRALLAYAIEVRVLAARLVHDGRLAAAESAAVVRAGGRSVPLGRVRSALAAEPDPGRRRELGAAADALVRERLDPHLRRGRDAELEALAEVGYAARREVMQSVEGIDVGTLAASGCAFLAASERRYRGLLAGRARELGLDPGELTAADLPALRITEEAYEPQELLARHDRHLGRIGLDPLASGRIAIDAEQRAGKSERSFCAPLWVPGDVRIAVGVDARGRAEIRSLLHESGHAQHRAGTKAELDVGARLLGDSSVTESYAFLMEGLVDGSADELQGLMLMRRYSALLIHELALERGWGSEPESEARSRFARLMSSATGVRFEGCRSLREPDPGFYSARYLRGWMLAAAWRHDLEGRFGPGWGSEPEAGARLRGLWAEGQRRDAERLAVEEAGAERLGIEALGYPTSEIESDRAAGPGRSR
jgi:hypothetical protein